MDLKILYLTWGETPRTYGVYNSQIIQQLTSIKEQFSEINVTLCAGLPIFHSGLVRERCRYMKELNSVKARLKLGGIDFCVIPMTTAQNFMYSSKASFPFMHGLNHVALFNKILTLKPDIVHCRSYHATWAALMIRKSKKIPYKVIFDARGRWPEEVALKKEWSGTNQNYQYWKAVEEFILHDSDCTVSLSEPMTNYFKQKSGRVKEIYTSAYVDRFQNHREIFDSANEKTILCYIGALNTSTWHTPENLLALYQHYRKFVDNPQLLIITTSNHENLRREFANIPQGELVITSTKTSSELVKLLSRVTYGALPFRKIDKGNSWERQVGETIIGTKTAEYLAAGIPVLANKECAAASTMIDEYGIGIVYNTDDYNEINQESLSFLVDRDVAIKAVDRAYDFFSYRNNSQRYVKLYQELMKGRD